MRPELAASSHEQLVFDESTLELTGGWGDFLILRLRPCRRPLWQLRASWLLAWWLGNILIGLDIAGLLGFCCLVFVLLVRSIAMCASFWMLVFMSFVWHWLLPRY